MQFSAKLIALVATLSSVQGAALLGFNYGATKSDGYTPMLEADFETLFTKAQNLAGTSGWNSARLYTSIQSGTSPTEAFNAAINTNTKLLLGLWGSAGDQTINNEIAAIKSAISQHGSKFTNLVIGISVGSEDLYRISEIGIKNKSGVGASPTDIASYITQTKQAFAGTALSGIPVGHVDTWTAWYNTSNQAVIDASDFIGVDAYPYFESTVANSIDNSRALFDTAIANVKSTVGGKEIWVTETGFPVTGPSSGQAVPGTAAAKQYWDQVGCGELFNVTNTFWYTLEDNYGGSLSNAGPGFGIVDSNGNEVFDLSCNGINKSPASSTSISGAASATNIGGGSPGPSDLPSNITASASANAGVSAGMTTSAMMSAVTTTNSAGQTVTTSVAVNGTNVATGSPTPSSTGAAQGAAGHIAIPVTGLFAAICAAFAFF